MFERMETVLSIVMYSASKSSNEFRNFSSMGELVNEASTVSC